MEDINLTGKYSELHRSYSLVSSNSDSKAEQQRVRFNRVLQGRKELNRSLTGSQITFILDYFLSEIFSAIAQIAGSSVELHEVCLKTLRAEHMKAIHKFFKSKKRLVSVRYSNNELLDKMLHLNFTETVADFSKLYLSLRLNRASYYETINKLMEALSQSEETLSGSLIAIVENHLKELRYFKGLLAGNYIRSAYSDMNKFYEDMKSKNYGDCGLSEREDYFSGLIVTTLNAIDRYDSFKGTLKTFVKNWFKEYRISYIDRLIKATSYELSAGIESNAVNLAEERSVLFDSPLSLEQEQLSEDIDVWMYVQRFVSGEERPSRLTKDLILSNKNLFPTINLLVQCFDPEIRVS